MNTKTIQLKQLHYGFRKESVDEVKSEADVDTTSRVLRMVVWEHIGTEQRVFAIEEFNIDKIDQKGRSLPMDKALQKAKTRARNLYGVENVKNARVEYCYAGHWNHR